MSPRLCPGRHSQTLGLFLPFSLSTGEQTEAEIRSLGLQGGRISGDVILEEGARLGGAKTGLYGQAPRGSTVSSFVTGFPLAAGPGLEALDSFVSSALKGSFGSVLS